MSRIAKSLVKLWLYERLEVKAKLTLVLTGIDMDIRGVCRDIVPPEHLVHTERVGSLKADLGRRRIHTKTYSGQ